ncbi:MAG: hypothetical protein V7459_17550 [Oceanicoccus sp.]
MNRFAAAVAFFYLFSSVVLALENNECSAAQNRVGKCEQSLVVEEETWLDDSRNYVGTSADDLAIWIDSFFSEPRTDIESADSLLRLTYESQWREGDGISENVKLRGKIHLPGINKRLSLVFADEEGDDLEERTDLDTLSSGSENTQLTLQYKAREGTRVRIDYGLGISSSLKGKAKVRYRYQLPWSETTTHRLTETLYFVDGDGFGLRSHYELDYAVTDSRLLRWSNNAKFAEDIDGVEWSTRLSLAGRLNKKRGASLFTWINGETRPKYLTKSYGLGLLFRRDFYRSWLFLEMEPAYAWRKKSTDLSRNGEWLFAVRVEMLID